MSSKRFYNAHIHSFTYDHVPAHFLTRVVAVSWLLQRKWLRKFIYATFTGKFSFWGSIVKGILNFLFGFNKVKLFRFLNFVVYGDKAKQEDVIASIQEYYPRKTGYIVLTMDMEYMGGGIPPTRYEQQLAELETLKNKPQWENKLYPFVFCDPRRILPTHKRELPIEKKFVGNEFIEKMKDYIQKGTFNGLKMYPALGYYPFDKRMKPVYDFAVENNIALMTHCTIGAVHFKYKLDDGERYHPFLKTALPAEKGSSFQKYFTHPLNFECLLNQQLLKTYWGEEAPDYSSLKICLGHWSTGEEWKRFIENAWSDTRYEKKDSDFPSLELVNWRIKEHKQYDNFSWFSIICDLIRKYPNVYADISYTLNDASLLPLLKMILEADDKIRERVLYGTDFYMVSKAISEREFAINIRAGLGNELFQQIAVTNTERYLDNKFYPMPLAW